MFTAISPAAVRRLPLWRALQSFRRFAATLVRTRPGTDRLVRGADCGLGIDLLPDGLGQLSSGSAVALLVQDPENQHTWLRELLVDALTAGPVFLLAEEQAWVDGLLENAPLRAAREQRQLTIFLIGAQMSTQVRLQGMAPVFAELGDAGLDATHALFVLGSHPWLLDRSVLELQRLASDVQQWCARRQRPVVFGFLNPANADDLLISLRNLFGLFPHIAMFGGVNGRPMLWLERWSGQHGAVFQTQLGLKQDATTLRLVHDGSRICGLTHQLIQAPDQYEVIATQASVSGQRGVPGHWKMVDHARDVSAAAEHSMAGTVLLDTGAADDFETLARLIHSLRQSHPRTLKIVIRETQGKLRTNKEQALLHLGANVVVYREVGFSRLLQLLQDINELSYTREAHPDYERALASFMPDAISGYQPPARFTTSVQAVLERTAGIGLKHTVVRLHMLPVVPHLDALRACCRLRDGDLLTADKDSLVVFLFACQAPDVDQALSRLFSIPVAQLFSSQITDSSDEGIRSILNKLQEAAHKGLPDYSLYLAPPAAGDLTAPQGVSVEAGRGPVDARLPELPANSGNAERGDPTPPTMPIMRPKPIARRLASIDPTECAP